MSFLDKKDNALNETVFIILWNHYQWIFYCTVTDNIKMWNKIKVLLWFLLKSLLTGFGATGGEEFGKCWCVYIQCVY